MSTHTDTTKDPDPTYGPRHAVLDAPKRDRRKMIRRRRGI